MGAEAGADGSTDPPDGSGDGSTPSDAGLCAPLGETRLCDPYCAERCPVGLGACAAPIPVCQVVPGDDPRGQENCRVGLNVPTEYCYTGSRVCLVSEEFASERPWVAWDGICVDELVCDWILTRPELAHLRCRYADGTFYIDGPPDGACGTDADPLAPFCGGRCGDTCPPTFTFHPPTCIGINEGRSFGVCTPFGSARCEPGSFSASILDECERRGRATCACMILTTLPDPEYADYGWGVAVDSCLAYRRAYPGEVRCYDREGREL